MRAYPLRYLPALALSVAACSSPYVPGNDASPITDAPPATDAPTSIDAPTADAGPGNDAASIDAPTMDVPAMDDVIAPIDAPAADTAPMPCPTLIPAMPGTRVVAAMQGWWGQSGHWSGVHYDSNDPTVVAQQQARAEWMGIHGFSVNWYGIGTHTDHTLAAQLSEAANRADFKVFAMYDGGALNSVLNNPSHTDADFTNLAVQQFQYLVDTYAADPNYLRINGRPVIQVFRKADTTPHVDWNAVVNAVGGPGAIELQLDGAGVQGAFTGGFAWIGPDSVDANGIWQGEGTARIDSFYATMASQHPDASVMGGVWNWFNDTRASWGSDCTAADGTTVRCRVIPANNGATWNDTWAHNLSHHPAVIQVITWDDYEEGSAIEPGVNFAGGLPQPWEPGTDLPPTDGTCGTANDGGTTVTDAGGTCPRAEALTVTWSDLSAEQPPCDGVTNTGGAVCMTAANRYCAARACSTAGFGTAGNISASGADVVCVQADPQRQVPYTTLATFHPSCDGTAQTYGPECAAAVQRYCRSLTGYTAGFGPVEIANGNATVICLRNGPATTVVSDFVTLGGFNGGCTASAPFGPACAAASQAYCRANGYEGGFGTVEHTSASATVVCVSR